MSQINQIQISFVPLEDRLLLRMNTADSSGFQFWVTRRYLKILWPVLLEMLQKDEQITVQQSEVAKKEVLSFQHQEAAQKMDYSKDFESTAQQQPLGDEPVLLAKVSIKPNEEGGQTLCMHPDQGQGIELALNQTLLHSICKLLQDTVANAEWDIDLSRSLATTALSPMVESAAIN